MLTHVDITITMITFTELLNKLLTSRPTAWSISGAWARVSCVARSAVAMTAHSVTYCVVVPNIRFTRYFTVQNGPDQEDHLSSLLTYMHAFSTHRCRSGQPRSLSVTTRHVWTKTAHFEQFC